MFKRFVKFQGHHSGYSGVYMLFLDGILGNFNELGFALFIALAEPTF